MASTASAQDHPPHSHPSHQPQHNANSDPIPNASSPPRPLLNQIVLHDHLTGRSMHPKVGFIFAGEEPSREMLMRAWLSVDLNDQGRVKNVSTLSPETKVNSYHASMDPATGFEMLHVDGTFPPETVEVNKGFSKSTSELLAEFMHRNDLIGSLLQDGASDLFKSIGTNAPAGDNKTTTTTVLASGDTTSVSPSSTPPMPAPSVPSSPASAAVPPHQPSLAPSEPSTGSTPVMPQFKLANVEDAKTNILSPRPRYGEAKASSTAIEPNKAGSSMATNKLGSVSKIGPGEKIKDEDPFNRLLAASPALELKPDGSGLGLTIELGDYKTLDDDSSEVKEQVIKFHKSRQSLLANDPDDIGLLPSLNHADSVLGRSGLSFHRPERIESPSPRGSSVPKVCLSPYKPCSAITSVHSSGSGFSQLRRKSAVATPLAMMAAGEPQSVSPPPPITRARSTSDLGILPQPSPEMEQTPVDEEAVRSAVTKIEELNLSKRGLQLLRESLSRRDSSAPLPAPERHSDVSAEMPRLNMGTQTNGMASQQQQQQQESPTSQRATPSRNLAQAGDSRPTRAHRRLDMDSSVGTTKSTSTSSPPDASSRSPGLSSSGSPSNSDSDNVFPRPGLSPPVSPSTTTANGGEAHSNLRPRHGKGLRVNGSPSGKDMSFLSNV